VNDKFTWGAQLDVVWAQLDIMMAAPAGDLFGNGYYTGGNGSLNTGLAQPFETLANTGAGSTGGLLGTILTPTINGAIDNYVGRVDFSDDNDFTGKAFGYGLGGKLGFTFKANDKLTIGGAYHTKTNISDMETSDSAATLAFYNAADGSPLNNGSYTGKITVKDFQWPSTLALGAAFQATPKLMLVADVKRINWSEIIKDFNMTFTDANGGGTLDFTIPQNWEDQTVFQVGGQYQVNDKLAVRAGYNYGKNPVPDNKLQPLFPATPEQHITAGFGYTVDNKNSFAASVVYVPEVKNTSTVSQDTAGTFDITHSQLNVSFNYVRKL
jgi:long-chain fatty acid transport protein